MNKQSNGGPVGPQKQNVTRSDLRRHSLTLYRVLRALQRKHPSLTSEQFWKMIQDHWTREHLNRAATSYAKTNRLTAFTKLIIKATEPLPRAGADGCFEADGEVWMTRWSIAKKTGITAPTVARYVAFCRSRQIKTFIGRLLPHYAFSDFEKVCGKLLKVTPQANEVGFFRAESEQWGTLASLAARLGISTSAIRSRFQPSRSRQGKVNGIPCTFYALSDVEVACADLLKEVPRAGGDGFFEADGERWGTLRALRRNLGIADTTITSRIRSCRSRNGKNRSGKPCTFYALSDVEVACADLLKEVPRAGGDGFFEADGERWGHCRALANRFGLSENTITSRCGSIRSREGKNDFGQRKTFYALSDVEVACADLLKEVPRAGGDGFFEADGERWGSSTALAKRLGICAETVTSRCDSSVRSREGKHRGGRICTYYSLSDVKRVCADLLKKKKRRRNRP